MISAIDFGCHEIRVAYHDETRPGKLTLVNELSQYAVLPKQENYLANLVGSHIPFAECEESYVVFGNHAEQVRWLSRKPLAPLFVDGRVPTDDAPARQILSVLTEAMLPDPSGSAVCCLTTPRNADSEAFLTRLVRMRGWNPILCPASQAVVLATGLENRFSGITIVMGEESTEICLNRFGREVATKHIDVGARWIDCELATTCGMKTWDAAGDSYLDIESVREWKQNPQVHLRRGIGEREKTLTRLYGAVLARVARGVQELITRQAASQTDRLPIICAGGAAEIPGFASLLTERLVEHDIASKLTTVRVADDSTTAVVRGLLISAELEKQAGAPIAA